MKMIILLSSVLGVSLTGCQAVEYDGRIITREWSQEIDKEIAKKPREDGVRGFRIDTAPNYYSHSYPRYYYGRHHRYGYTRPYVYHHYSSRPYGYHPYSYRHHNRYGYGRSYRHYRHSYGGRRH